jgi:hypothetical protein
LRGSAWWLGDEVGYELGDGKGEKPLVFEMQTLIALDNICKKFRCPVLRRKAILLLKGRRMREGVWDSVVLEKVGEWIMRVEEEGMVDRFIEEKWRVKDASVGLHHEGRKATVRCWGWG